MSECSSKGTCGKSSCEGCSQNTAKGPQSMQVKENAHKVKIGCTLDEKQMEK